LFAGVAQGQILLSEDAASAGLIMAHLTVNAAIPGNQECMTGGLCVGDFDRDGDPDVFCVSGGLEPDRLFINAGDGTFTDQAADWGLTDLHLGSGTAAGDFDRDGWIDIYVTSFGPAAGSALPGRHRLYRNDHGTSLVDVAAAAGVNYSAMTTPSAYGSAFGDYDLDGDLDLFVASWTAGAPGNRLYRNNGNGTFSNVTIAALGSALSGVRGYQPAFADMNGDLFPELLLAADFETSRYFANDRDGTFTDLTAGSGTGLDDNGMGQTIGDFDNDGRLDWYVTSILGTTPPDGNGFENPGNMLYMNVGLHVYVESSALAGTLDGGWGWGAAAADLDQDGWLDIVEVNGWGHIPEYLGEPARLFRNLGGVFEEVAAASGLDHAGEGRSIATFDADGDGDLDLLIGNNNEPLSYYRNDTPAGGAWLQVRLVTEGHPLLAPDGFGTTVVATAGGKSIRRVQNGAPSYLATSDAIVHLGLGLTDSIQELRVEWARGQVTIIKDVVANQRITVEAPALADLSADGAVEATDLVLLLLAWGEVVGPEGIRADLDNDGQVGVADLITLIMAWG
jgi:hypothetical protein